MRLDEAFGGQKAGAMLHFPSHLFASRWKTVVVFLSLVLSLLIFSTAPATRDRRKALLSDGTTYLHEHIDPILHSNSEHRLPFQHHVHAHNYALTEAQCDAYFPGLFEEIEKSVAHRRDRPIEESELDEQGDEESNTRLLIYDGALYVIADGSKRPDERTLAMLHDLHRAMIADPERHKMPNIEFILGREDWIDSKRVQWGLTKRVEDVENWLVPDFGFWSWPTPSVGSYQSILRKVEELEGHFPTFGSKINKLVWRGSLGVGHNVREYLFNNSRNKTWADVEQLKWPKQGGLPTNLIYIEDHCKYQFIAHTEGNSYSGRQKYIHNCNSVIVSHELGWLQPWHKFMIEDGPYQNYVKVKLDFSDLDEKMRFYTSRTDLSAKIAKNNVKTFRDRYLTPAAQACYWRKLIRGYASVSFKPRLYGEPFTVNRTDGVPVEPTRTDMDFMTRPGKQWRGTPFENYAINGQLDTRIARRFGYACYDEEEVRKKAIEKIKLDEERRKNMTLLGVGKTYWNKSSTLDVSTTTSQSLEASKSAALNDVQRIE